MCAREHKVAEVACYQPQEDTFLRAPTAGSKGVGGRRTPSVT